MEWGECPVCKKSQIGMSKCSDCIAEERANLGRRKDDEKKDDNKK